MKRFSSSLLILLAILTQSPVSGQSGEPAALGQPLHLVVLRAPSLAEKLVEWSTNGRAETPRALLHSELALRYRQDLAFQQEQFIDSVRGELVQAREQRSEPSIEVLDRQTDLLNMLVVRASEGALDALRANPEVAGVFPNATRWPAMDAAPDLVAAPQLWQKLGGAQHAGTGIRIAIIDSGINVTHPMLRDDSLSAPAGFPQPAQFQEFTNSKVIVARDYVLTRFGLKAETEATPRDLAGHGSRVAAAAGGNSVGGPVGVVQGIAPKAFLGNYRVFGDPSINPTTTSAAIIAALRDALFDGMHVVNLSLGGPATDPFTDPEQLAIANAVEMGVVVVIAAGNNGARGAGSITSPGTSPAAITVGATSHKRALLNALQVSSDEGSVPPQLETIEFQPGNGAPLAQPLGPLPLVSILDQDASQEACSPLQPGSLSGMAALVRRGTCLFSDKAHNTLTIGGAAALILYNNVDGPPVRPSFGNNPPTRPAGMITLQEGEQLIELLSQGEQLEVTLEPLRAFPRIPDILAGFSGRGPNIDGSIKPDLVAPGMDILSAGPQGDTYILASNGTSFATPQVAGAAALLLQQNPEWNPAIIKSVLVNTAAVATSDGQNAASPNLVGAGRLDLSAVAETVISADPVSLSFGNLYFSDGTLPPFSLTLTNLSPDSLEVQLATLGDQPDLRLLMPETVTLPPRARVEVTIRPALSGSPLPGVFEGSIRILIPERPSLRIPFWGNLTVAESGNVLQVSTMPLAQFSNLGAALAEAQPGDIIEIQDNATYQGAVELFANRGGLRLHGLTLRAAPGRTPTLEAPAGAEAVILIDSLENIAIEGLRLRGATHGVLAKNASGVVRDCVFESDQQVAVRLDSSLFNLYGNVFRPAVGGGIALFNSSSALIQKNQIGEAAGGRWEFGVFTSMRGAALFDNRVMETAGDSNGQGLRISGPALIKNNLVESTRGVLGDGILVRGSGAAVHLQDNLVVGSRRNGISIFDGAEATLLRNRSISNSAAGLLVQDSTADAVSCSFLDNQLGIQANFVLTLALDNSLVARSRNGDGLAAINDPESELRIDGCTFADNSQFGVSWDQGILDVSNSIFWANGRGDLSQNPSTARFSLFEDGALAGQSGNYVGDPRFTSPSTFDYSLTADSDAVDRGSRDEVPLHPGDLLSHQRVVDGNNDGVATIDTGAAEFASPFAPPLVMPLLSGAAGEFQGLALVNVYAPPESSQPAATNPGRVRLRHFDASGALRGEIQREIGPNSQLAALLGDLFPAAAGGWVEILASDPDLLSFTLTGANNLRYLDGAQIESAQHRTLVLPEIRTQGEESSSIYVINPQPQAQRIRIRWRADGSAPEVVERQLAAKAMLAARVRDLFPAATHGFLEIEGDEPIAAMELFGNSQARAGLAGIPPSLGVTQLIGAHLASTSDIETHLNLVNLGAQAVVTLTALDGAGAVLDQVTREFAPFEQLSASVREVFELPGQDVVGWLAIRSLSSDLVGSLRFEDPAARFLAALPLQPGGAREFLLSQVAQTSRIFTGLALVNFGTDAAAVSVEVFSQGASLQGVAFLSLQPGQKIAQLLSQLLPKVSQQSGGFIRVRSTQPLAGFELFGDRALNYLSAVPQQVVVR